MPGMKVKHIAMKTLDQIMVDTPRYCGQNDSLQLVAEQMHKSNIGGLPVLDKNQKVIGMITDRDVCLALGKNPGRPVTELKVSDAIAQGKVHTLSINDDVKAALRTMRTKQVRRVPVVDNEQKLKGIVTLTHILRHTHGTSDEKEIAYSGEENVMKTLHSIAMHNAEVPA